MRAILLAGGLGTRIREETEFRPKPMVEVGGKNSSAAASAERGSIPARTEDATEVKSAGRSRSNSSDRCRALRLTAITIAKHPVISAGTLLSHPINRPQITAPITTTLQ